MHKVQGDIAFADRAEMIAYNAQPAAMTADMWARNYLSQINEIAALTTNPHPWITDGPASTTYGLAPNFPCCTANHNQVIRPKICLEVRVLHMLWHTPSHAWAHFYEWNRDGPNG